MPLVEEGLCKVQGSSYQVMDFVAVIYWLMIRILTFDIETELFLSPSLSSSLSSTTDHLSWSHPGLWIEKFWPCLLKWWCVRVEKFKVKWIVLWYSVSCSHALCFGVSSQCGVWGSFIVTAVVITSASVLMPTCVAISLSMSLVLFVFLGAWVCLLQWQWIACDLVMVMMLLWCWWWQCWWCWLDVAVDESFWWLCDDGGDDDSR